jgi:soluble P-type ATPase
VSKDQFTVVQISDTHFQPDLPESFGRFVPIRRRIREIRPDLTVMAGDLCTDPFNENGLDEIRRAKSQLDQIDGPVFAIPGNHDVGGQINVNRPTTTGLTTIVNLDRWNQIFEKDHFCFERDRWMLIGVNSQALASELPQSTEQWAWLDARLLEASKGDRLVAVFMHTPPFVVEQGEPHVWGWPVGPRRQILERLDRPQVRLVSAAHIHWHQCFERAHVKWVTSPAVMGTLVDDPRFPHGGDITGLLRLNFSPEGVSHEAVVVGSPTERYWFARNEVDIPGRGTVVLGHLVINFTGTISEDGTLLPGVAERIEKLAENIRITVMTAENYSTAVEAFRELPVGLKLIGTGAKKGRFIRDIGGEFVVAVGNTRSDVEMIRSAEIGIAVIGPEGLGNELVRVADVVVRDFREALDLIANPLRLKATLRD